ncbi:MAG: Asp-tRNA(Asn)/Glu-tRNA(Gln) amidotransferase subunit GatC [Candidatus Dormibacteraeota bacterium]|nr:Asp-tRNA(Asn)/Glu-tRNA(Gln) amidotransferase subunit GatC [Candidatus Dormibacteraeota bacterium]
MPLTDDEVRHVATLARLGLSDDERTRLRSELETILGHISRLQQVDTSAISETAQVGELVNVMRDDVARESLPQEVALDNAPATDGVHFVVGAIQDSDPAA